MSFVLLMRSGKCCTQVLHDKREASSHIGNFAKPASLKFDLTSRHPRHRELHYAITTLVKIQMCHCARCRKKQQMLHQTAVQRIRRSVCELIKIRQRSETIALVSKEGLRKHSICGLMLTTSTVHSKTRQESMSGPRPLQRGPQDWEPSHSWSRNAS